MFPSGTGAMPTGRGGGVMPTGVAACVDEAVKAVIVATPASTMPATAKPPIVLNDFDFEVLYDILMPPCSPCGGCCDGRRHRVSETTSCDPRGFVRTVATPRSFEADLLVVDESPSIPRGKLDPRRPRVAARGSALVFMSSLLSAGPRWARPTAEDPAPSLLFPWTVRHVALSVLANARNGCPFGFARREQHEPEASICRDSRTEANGGQRLSRLDKLGSHSDGERLGGEHCPPIDELRFAHFG